MLIRPFVTPVDCGSACRSKRQHTHVLRLSLVGAFNGARIFFVVWAVLRVSGRLVQRRVT
jgi:hypothetical protein